MLGGYRSAMSTLWNRLALALLILGIASFAVAAATHDRALSASEMPLVTHGEPDSVTLYAELDEGVDHDFFLGSGFAFLLAAGVVGTFSLRHQRQVHRARLDAG